jgi:hypothetical protein
MSCVCLHNESAGEAASAVTATRVRYWAGKPGSSLQLCQGCPTPVRMGYIVEAPDPPPQPRAVALRNW